MSFATAQTATSKKTIEEQFQELIKRLSDPNRGMPEIIQTLRQSLSLTDGVLVVDDPLTIGISGLSPTSPWLVKCGAGLEVIFWNAVAGEDVHPHDGAKISLSFVPVLDKARCKQMTIIIGKEIEAITGGH
jgi:hypothetical protein